MVKPFSPDQLREQHAALNEALQSGKLNKQSNRVFSDEKAQRLLAGKGDQKLKQPVFLRPQDIQKGVDYDLEKVYLTTMGKGELRILTRDDLIAFKKNIDLLKDHYVKGITAKQVINLSLPTDVDLANKQIHYVMPMSIKNGVVRFMTNSSRPVQPSQQNKPMNRFIDVEFVKYESLALSPSEITIADIKKHLTLGKIKFQCSCERHTYWYRYIASIGGYNYGRVEEGYPKIRNPNLAGVACKHAIKVMSYILSPMGINTLQRFLKEERKKQLGKLRKVSKKQAVEIVDQQLETALSGKAKQIKQSQLKVVKELNDRAKRLAKENQQATMKALREQKRLTEQQAKEQMKVEALAKLNELYKAGAIPKEMYDLYKKGVK